MKAKLINFALYQGGWFACVFGAADGHPWLGAGAAFLLVAVHATLAVERRAEWGLIAAVGVFGTVVDSLLMHVGVFQFGAGRWLPWLCPLWMSVMWMQFATLLRFSIGWLAGRYLLGAALGAVGGPVAYASGVRLGAAEFGLPTPTSLLILGFVWGVVTPILLWIDGRLCPGNARGEYRL